MKKSVFTYSFSIIFLISVFAILSFFVKPVMSKISFELEKIQNHYLLLLEENMGLAVSYDSLSPSIFTGLHMVNIQISDAENKSSLVSIDSIKLRWNILKLFNENPTDAFGKLIINGLHAEYNNLENNNVLQKILQALQGTQEANAEPIEPVQTEIVTEEDLQVAIQNALEPLFVLPIDIQLKNTSLLFSSDSFKLQTLFSKIEVFDQDVKGLLNLAVNGQVYFLPNNDEPSLGSVALQISLKGRVSQNLDNSFAQMSLSSLQESDFIVPRFDFHTTYSNNTLQAVAMQNVLPFSIELLCNFFTKQLDFSFDAENFEFFDLIAYEGENEMLRNLKGSEISGGYNVSYNWDSGKLLYDANGSTKIPPLFIDESLTVRYFMYGDLEELTIDSFDIISPSISANYVGSVNLQTFIPVGFITIENFTAPSGNSLSTEIYIDSLNDDVIVFAPQIHLEEKTLTALHLDIKRNNNTLDFNFEVSDYSRSDVEDPGVLSANGSYDFSSAPYFQMELLSESFFLASVNEILLWYLPQEQSQPLGLIADAISPYIFSFNVFFSSDFNSFSYSLPYAIISNTQRDDEFLLFSANGNESLFQVSNVDMLVAGQSVQANASGDLGDGSSEVFFNSSLYLNSIPYTFSGVYMPNEYVSLSGDYDFAMTVSFAENISSTIQMLSLPISANDLFLSLSIDSEIQYTSSNDWNVLINSFLLENVATTSVLQPSFSFAGNINTNGAFFDYVTYSDDVSRLDGVFASSWNIDQSILSSATLNVSLVDSFSNERYEANLEAFNLDGSSFAEEDFFSNMFFSADVLVQESPASRFVNFQTETNTINAQLTAQGTLENPSINLLVDNSSFSLGGNNADFAGSISLQDYEITVNNVNATLGQFSFQNIYGNFALDTFSGSLDGFIDGRLSDESYFAEKTFASPVSLSLESLGDNENLSFDEKTFEINVIFEEIVSSFLPQLKNYSVNVRRTPGRFDVQAGLDSEVVGYLLDNGEISIIASEGFFVQFDAFGILESDELSLFFNNIFADAQDFSSLVDLPVFSLHSGMVVGSGTLTGPLSDLQINADLLGTNMEISVPDYVNERLVCETFPVTVSQNVFSSENANFVAQETKTGVNLSVALSLEQLQFTYISLDIETMDEEFVLGKYTMPYGTFAGFAQTNLTIYVGGDVVEVSGEINTKEIEAIISLASSESMVVATTGDVIVDLLITIENQSQLYFPSKASPIIRGLVNQVEPLLVQMDTRYATSLIAGEFNMRGGEILYLNRTFFARDASVIFNESVDAFDPRITASAEIRERDENGDPVRIILSVNDQRLTQLDPQFESIPSMSEQDIMTLLGQVILGSTDDINPLSLLGSLADYGTQFIVFRALEDSARDFLNLDIFSLRTMFVQNALENAIDDTTTDSVLTVGDFLDSTTIYIGKFLNETLYADAMLSLVYDSEREDLGLGGLVFQPEFGLELPSPFATIRWGIAPDLTSDWNLLVPYTSISFSWKFDL